MNPRSFTVENFVRLPVEKAVMAGISVATPASIAVRGVRPGQEVPAHTHPDGQDAWVMLRGSLTCCLGNGQRRVIRSGDVDAADRNEVHGAINEGREDAVFLSICSAPKPGWVKAAP